MLSEGCVVLSPPPQGGVERLQFIYYILFLKEVLAHFELVDSFRLIYCISLPFLPFALLIRDPSSIPYSGRHLQNVWWSGRLC